MEKLILHEDPISGNCYKIKLMLSLLGVPYEWVAVDILKGETRTPAFLQKNPNGKIPVLELEDGTCLWESNAILNFLADSTHYLPSEPRLRTQVLQWQFFEQYSHEPSIAVARFIQFYLGLPEERLSEYRSLQKAGYRALSVMEQQLKRTPFLVGDTFSIADIALYAYTHVAHQGGFDLTPYPGIQQWLERVKEQPGYVGMLD